MVFFKKTKTKQKQCTLDSTREQGRFQCIPGPHSWNTRIAQVNLRPKKLKNHFSKVFLKVSFVFEFVLCLKICFDLIPQVLTADHRLHRFFVLNAKIQSFSQFQSFCFIFRNILMETFLFTLQVISEILCRF